jgi:hypothetical protein
MIQEQMQSKFLCSRKMVVDGGGWTRVEERGRWWRCRQDKRCLELSQISGVALIRSRLPQVRNTTQSPDDKSIFREDPGKRQKMPEVIDDYLSVDLSLLKCGQVEALNNGVVVTKSAGHVGRTLVVIGEELGLL